MKPVPTACHNCMLNMTLQSQRQSIFRTRKKAIDLVRSTPLHRAQIEDLLGDLILNCDSNFIRGVVEVVMKRPNPNSRIKSLSTSSDTSPPRQRKILELINCCLSSVHQLNSHLKNSIGACRGCCDILRSAILDVLFGTTLPFIFSKHKKQNSQSAKIHECTALFHRGSAVEERLQLCFSCFDVNQRGWLNTNDLRAIFHAAYAFFCPSIAEDDISGLAARAVRQRNLSRTKQLEF